MSPTDITLQARRVQLHIEWQHRAHIITDKEAEEATAAVAMWALAEIKRVLARLNQQRAESKPLTVQVSCTSHDELAAWQAYGAGWNVWQDFPAEWKVSLK